MRVLVACECSGKVRESFRLWGHDAWSCDLLPPDDGSEYHIMGDVLKELKRKWDLVIAFPPCTYLANCGLHYGKKDPARWALTEQAAKFFLKFTDLDCRWCVENPAGWMSTKFRKPDQIINPYEFGHDYAKRTCLWMRGLPLLRPTRYYPPRMVGDQKRWSNQTDSGAPKLGKSVLRSKIKSETFAGVAAAMGSQWSRFIKNVSCSVSG